MQAVELPGYRDCRHRCPARNGVVGRRAERPHRPRGDAGPHPGGQDVRILIPGPLSAPPQASLSPEYQPGVTPGRSSGSTAGGARAGLRTGSTTRCARRWSWRRVATRCSSTPSTPARRWRASSPTCARGASPPAAGCSSSTPAACRPSCLRGPPRALAVEGALAAGGLPGRRRRAGLFRHPVTDGAGGRRSPAGRPADAASGQHQPRRHCASSTSSGVDVGQADHRFANQTQRDGVIERCDQNISRSTAAGARAQTLARHRHRDAAVVDLDRTAAAGAGGGASRGGRRASGRAGGSWCGGRSSAGRRRPSAGARRC